MAQIKFIQLTQSKYNSLQDKPSTSIFFTTDTNRIYKGDALFTKDFQIITTVPTNGASLQLDRLYVVSTTGDMYIRQDVNNTPTVVQVGGNSAAMASAQQAIASNYSTISAISEDLYKENGFEDRIEAAESSISALDQLANTKLAQDLFNSYSSTTAATISTINGNISDIDGRVSSNAADIDALQSSLSDLTTSSAVQISSSAGSDSILQVYTIYQGGQSVGTINIPKDLVVSSGSVVKGTWTNGQFAESAQGNGTALKLVIANQAEPVYINTLDLVKDHTGSTVNGITVAISDTNVISVSIADGTIASSTLSSDVQTSLAKADTALQSGATYYTDIKVEANGDTLAVDMNSVKSRIEALEVFNGSSLSSLIDAKIAQLDSASSASAGNYINSITIVDGKIASIGEQALPTYTLTSGSANGTVSFNGLDVPVTGLGSAAYTDSTAYDASGSAAAVQSSLTGTAQDSVSTLTLNGLSNRIAAVDSGDNSVYVQISSAQAAASAYTDAATSWYEYDSNGDLVALS